jgi:hypothetical protein
LGTNIVWNEVARSDTPVQSVSKPFNGGVKIKGKFYASVTAASAASEALGKAQGKFYASVTAASEALGKARSTLYGMLNNSSMLYCVYINRDGSEVPKEYSNRIIGRQVATFTIW